MNDKGYYLSLLSGTLLMLLPALLFARPIAAQTDLLIMVSGSWDYVVDPHPDWDTNSSPQKRIILVAAQSMQHQAYLFQVMTPGNIKSATIARWRPDYTMWIL